MKITRGKITWLEDAIEAVVKRLNDPKAHAVKVHARTGRPPSDFDDEVETFLRWWHSSWGRKFKRPYVSNLKYKGEMLRESDLNFVAMRLLRPVVEALVNGDGQKLKKLGSAVTRVHRRCSGGGESFRIRPAKPQNLKAIEIAERHGASAEDIYQAVVREFRGSGKVPTERHLRRIAAALHIPPANKGGFHTRRP